MRRGPVDGTGGGRRCILPERLAAVRVETCQIKRTGGNGLGPVIGFTFGSIVFILLFETPA